MKKHCELCKGIARMHCESDQASLCWDCDAKVHSANFLVARHFRNFLCHVCQSPSPWSTAGTKSRPEVFVCQQCVGGRGCHKEEAEEQAVAPWSPPPPSEYTSSDDEVPISKKRCRNKSASLNSSSDNICSTEVAEDETGCFLSIRRTTPAPRRSFYYGSGRSIRDGDSGRDDSEIAVSCTLSETARLPFTRAVYFNYYGLLLAAGCWKLILLTFG